MPAPSPVFIPKAFAVDASPTFRNDIPEDPIGLQRASWSDGFPEQTMTPIVSGGKPMLGPDMNGTLYAISSHTVYQQGGELYKYNADVVVALIGYGVGTILGSTDNTTIWFNLVDGNDTDPDAVDAEGWTPLYSYGITSLPPTTGGTVTITVAQAKYPVLVISGALTSNLQLVLPNTLRRWLIVNTTSGAFTTTVRTAAGTGVQVPQGGFGAPVEVYGDGTNIYNVVAPTAIPTDVAPTPNTIVMRSNAGFVYAVNFNMSNGQDNTETPTAFFYEAFNDGFIRKCSPARFQQTLSLSLIGGQVLNAQVPVGAVNQYRSTILNDSALTGTPTAPTQAAGTNNTTVATTQFANGSGSLTANGYWRMPGGLILQWGYATGSTNEVPVVFPLTFPNAAFMCAPVTNRTSASSEGSNFCASLGQNGALLIMDARSGVGAGFGGWWFAVGY